MAEAWCQTWKALEALLGMRIPTCVAHSSWPMAMSNTADPRGTFPQEPATFESASALHSREPARRLDWQVYDQVQSQMGEWGQAQRC